MTVIKLVNSNITKDKNAILANYTEDFDFDKSIRVGYNPVEITNNTYFKHNLNTSIKIEIDQSARNIFNYCYIQNENENKFYYFITDAKWTSQKSAELVLEMDTIATYWGNLNQVNTWSESTELIRHFKDRFNRHKSSGNTLYRKIDKISEGLDQPKEYLQSVTDLPQRSALSRDSDLSWYLLYKSNNSESATAPLSCWAIPSKTLNFKTSTTPEEPTVLENVTLTASDFATDEFRVFIVQDQVAAQDPWCNANVSHPSSSYNWHINTSTCVVVYKMNSTQLSVCKGTISGGAITFPTDGSTYGWLAYLSSVELHNVVGYRKFTHTPWTTGTTSGSRKAGSGVESVQIVQGYEFKAFGTPPSQNVTIDGIDTLDRSDSTLVRLVKLPYAPFNVAVEGDRYIIPNGWRTSVLNTRTYLFLDNLNLTLSNYLNAFSYQNNFRQNIPATLKSEQLAMFLATRSTETKLLHSDYTIVKWVYDSASKQRRYEDLNPDDPIESITFVASNGFTNNLIWKIEPSTTYDSIEDYESILTSTRNLESPIYNNAYANYVRSGQAQRDEESLTRNTAISTTLAALQIIGGIAAAATGAGAGIGAGLIFSGASTAIATVNNTINAEQNLQSKKEQLLSQSTSIKGNNDIELVSVYNPNNKLQLIIYTPSEQVRNSIYNLFRFYGYKASTRYGNPILIAGRFEDLEDYGWCLHSRRCYDYLECIPKFNKRFALNDEVLNNIKERFQQGLTIYHYLENTNNIKQFYEVNELGDLYAYHDLNYAIDWNKELENWEEWIMPSRWID